MHALLLRGIGAVAVATVMLLPVAAQADTFQVQMAGSSFIFNGQENMDIDLMINPGDTVEWLWVEGPHNVVSGFPGEPGEGDLFNSGDPTDVPGTTFEFTFNDPGTFGYHCEVHEDFGMISQVTVVPEPASALLLCFGAFVFRSRRR